MPDGDFQFWFKYYKSRNPPPSLAEVADFSTWTTEQQQNAESFKTNDCQVSEEILQANGLRPLKEWRCYILSRRKGLIYIRNPFSSFGQKLWIRKCLEEYTKKPNKLNIDAHGILDQSQDWWETSNGDLENGKILLKKLRWSTLGYHHNWDTKVYSEDYKNDFPEGLSELCKILAAVVGFGDFIPQASIVNYYHMDSTLAPHTDHSELNLQAPLISISFGQSAVFLIGDESKETKPSALYLHSGDVLVMSGESRLCYHAVPRVVPSPDRPWDTTLHDEDRGTTLDPVGGLYDNSQWKPFEDYLTHSRINLNVRQVLFTDQSSLVQR